MTTASPTRPIASAQISSRRSSSVLLSENTCNTTTTLSTNEIISLLLLVLVFVRADHFSQLFQVMPDLNLEFLQQVYQSKHTKPAASKQRQIHHLAVLGHRAK